MFGVRSGRSPSRHRMRKALGERRYRKACPSIPGNYGPKRLVVFFFRFSLPMAYVLLDTLYGNLAYPPRALRILWRDGLRPDLTPNIAASRQASQANQTRQQA